MEPFEKKILAQLSAADKDTQLHGVRQALEQRLYGLIKPVSRLITAKDEDVAESACAVALSLARGCVTDRNTLAAEPYIQPAVECIRQYDASFIDDELEKLSGNNDAVLIDAIMVLRHFLDEHAARKALSRLMTHSSEKVRATAVLHMGMIASRTNVDVLTGFLKDSDNRVKANAVEVIEWLNRKSLLRALERFRADPNNRIRGNVLKALFSINREDVYADLEQMLRHDKPLMRTTAVWVIGEIGQEDHRYLNLLRIVQNDSYQLVRDNLRIAAKKVGDVPELEFLQGRLKEILKEDLKHTIIKRSGLDVETERKEQYLAIRLSGTISFSTVMALKLQLEEILKKEKELVLDFGEVSHIDSSGISLLVNLSKKIEEKQGFIFVCSCNYAVNELLQLSKLDQRLHVFQNEEEIEAFVEL
jgi:anti-anti-sigma factor